MRSRQRCLWVQENKSPSSGGELGGPSRIKCCGKGKRKMWVGVYIDTLIFSYKYRLTWHFILLLSACMTFYVTFIGLHGILYYYFIGLHGILSYFYWVTWYFITFIGLHDTLYCFYWIVLTFHNTFIELHDILCYFYCIAWHFILLLLDYMNFYFTFIGLRDIL